MLYLPVLAFFGILSGIAIGIAANYLLQRVDTLRRFQLDYERQTNVKWRSDSKIKESFMKLHPMWQAYPALQKTIYLNRCN